ncbi:MAG: hypothetical protein HC815_19460 [Richelia sp. RM1_1_1]|nr:hypothetical protein [Richelia sp. RM1_1_1]
MEFLKNNKIKYIREELRYPAFETERYYCCKEVNNLNVFSSIEANKLYFNYIEITGSRYANIAVQAVNNVVDSNTPAINFRIGIYTRGFRLPEKLIASEQIVLDAVDRNGLLETANLNLELVGGIYALAYVASESNFMLSVTENNSSGLINTYGVLPDTSNLQSVQTGLKYNYPYAALPTEFIDSNYARENCNASPLIFIKS